MEDLLQYTRPSAYKKKPATDLVDRDLFDKSLKRINVVETLLGIAWHETLSLEERLKHGGIVYFKHYQGTFLIFHPRGRSG